MKSRGRRVLRWVPGVMLAFIAVGGLAALLAIRSSRQPPRSRLALDAEYPEMPGDARHIYINLPLDHADSSRGAFRAFYQLSPGFAKGRPVVFLLTDGQMELVGTSTDFAFFDAQLPGLSYVVIAHRGHVPTRFPEAYREGGLDHERAMELYGSWARVEDVERVRIDMVRRHLLPDDGRIMLFGASGAGVLAQQYLSRHGEHVSRALLVTTGAPDLARVRGWDYARNVAEFDSSAASALSSVLRVPPVDPTNLSYLLFQLGRQGASGRARLHRVLDALGRGNRLPYVRQWANPSHNLPLARALLRGTAADAARVRMYELLGSDLRDRARAPSPSPSLMYPWAAEVLSDFLGRDMPLPVLDTDRSRYAGEVLVVSATDDVVFSPAIGQAIAEAYPDGRFLLVPGGHRLERDLEYHAALRQAFFTRGLHARETEQLLRAPPSP